MIRLHKTNNLIYSVGFLPLTLDSIRTVGEDKSQSLKKISRKRFSCVSCLARFFPIYRAILGKPSLKKMQKRC